MADIFCIPGDTPYGESMKSRDVPSFLRGGSRLTKPEQCDDT